MDLIQLENSIKITKSKRPYKINCFKNNTYYTENKKAIKITIGKYNFFVDDNFNITEEQTGYKIQQTEKLLKNKNKSINIIIKYLLYIYVFIDINMQELEKNDFKKLSRRFN